MNLKDLKSMRIGELTETDVVLIKGSHGLRMDRIIAAVEVAS